MPYFFYKLKKTYSNQQFLYHLYSVLPFLLSLTSILWFRNGHKSIVIVALVYLIIRLFVQSKKIITTNIYNNPWLKYILLLSIFSIFNYCYNSTGSIEVRSLLVVFTLLLVTPKKTFNLKSLQYLLFAGAVNITAIIVYYQIIEPTNRFDWPVNAIPLATIAAFFSISSLTMLINNIKNKHKAILWISLILSTYATLLTESRGPIIALIIILGLSGYYYLLRSKKLIVKVMAIALVVVIGFLSVKPYMSARITQTINEVKHLEKGDFSTSIGLRLQMYQLGWTLIKEKPILGYGKTLQPKLNDLLDKKQITPSVHRVVSWTFHNNFIEKQVNSGILGSLLLMSLFIYPIYLTKKHSPVIKCLVINISLLYFLCSFVDTPFTTGQSLIIYLIMIGYIERAGSNLNNIQREKE